MSDNFLARLREGRLTCTEEYQRTKDALAACKEEADESPSEEWTTWQLMPVVKGSDTADSDIADKGQFVLNAATGGGKDVLHAIKTLDRQLK